MIDEVIVKNIATYSTEGVKLNGLQKINYFYGTNGSGKTTLSNIMKSSEDFPDSQINWSSQPSKIFVYNQKFVEENFHQDSNIKGIFTLGKESTEIKSSITEKRKQIDKIDGEITGLSNNLKSKEEEYNENENEFVEECWELKRKYDNVFLEAFTGLRNNKVLFMDKCKKANTIESELCEFEDLKKRSNELFKGNSGKSQIIETILIDELNFACSDEIFQNQIVGRQEVDIASLISKLGISDWVKRGYDHIHETEGICPFCQRLLPDEFIQKLEEYFNETYENELKELKYSIDSYKSLYNKLEFSIQKLLEKEIAYLDFSKVKQQFELIKSRNEINLELLNRKQKEPSKRIELIQFNEFVDTINDGIEQANKEIKKHNDMVDNRAREEKVLKEKIWRFIAEENRQNSEKYIRKEYGLNNAISGIKNRMESKLALRRDLLLEIESLEAQITSVIPTVNEMNRLLKVYNFTNFKFAHTQSQGNYRLIRANGEDVNQTLSEGEKTFVTFLYFMHLLNGSNNRDLITENRIVVIDDPISSLDSNVLFIVSSLILKLIDDIRNNKSNVVQLFVLTHNIYFHKEVTFNRKRRKDKLHDETFWIIRKINNITEVQSYDTNPIRTSYELLWQELRMAQDRSSTTVQNLIRRIIENYFKIFGNYSEDDIIARFEEEERVICKSLVSWANDGSHFANDDLYIEHPVDITNRYLQIFEKIFIVTHHHSHYKMMMGIEEIPEEQGNQFIRVS